MKRQSYIYHFSRGETKMLWRMANYIQEEKKLLGLSLIREDGSLYNPRDRYGGLAAEYAVGRLWGACPLLSVGTGSDQGLDLFFPGANVSADVKFLRNRQADLIFRSIDKRKLQSSWYIVVSTGLERRTMEIIGVLPGEKVHELAIVRNYSFGEKLSLMSVDLWPPEILGEQLLAKDIR